MISERLFTMPQEYDQINPECLVPGKDFEVVSRKGGVVDREGFEQMKSEFYELRRWDVSTGLQTRETLESMDLKEVADDLEPRGLLA